MDRDDHRPGGRTAVLPHLPAVEGSDDERVPQGREAQGQRSARVFLPELQAAVVRAAASEVSVRCVFVRVFITLDTTARSGLVMPISLSCSHPPSGGVYVSIYVRVFACIYLSVFWCVYVPICVCVCPFVGHGWRFAVLPPIRLVITIYVSVLVLFAEIRDRGGASVL